MTNKHNHTRPHTHTRARAHTTPSRMDVAHYHTAIEKLTDARRMQWQVKIKTKTKRETNKQIAFTLENKN